MSKRRLIVGAGVGVAILVAVAGVREALGHCDGLDGPVVQAAKRALDSRNVNLALIWVLPQDEPEIRAAFKQAISVRTLSPDAAALADRYFFETLVRLHRSGEGAPYTGLKPAGRDLGPAIRAADAAVMTGNSAALEKLLIEDIRRGLKAHFDDVRSRRGYDADDLHEGREYVRAYVEFIHYAERLHESAKGAVNGHYTEGSR